MHTVAQSIKTLESSRRVCVADCENIITRKSALLGTVLHQARSGCALLVAL